MNYYALGQNAAFEKLGVKLPKTRAFDKLAISGETVAAAIRSGAKARGVRVMPGLEELAAAHNTARAAHLPGSPELTKTRSALRRGAVDVRAQEADALLAGSPHYTPGFPVNNAAVNAEYLQATGANKLVPSVLEKNRLIDQAEALKAPIPGLDDPQGAVGRAIAAARAKALGVSTPSTGLRPAEELLGRRPLARGPAPAPRRGALAPNEILAMQPAVHELANTVGANRLNLAGF